MAAHIEAVCPRGSRALRSESGAKRAAHSPCPARAQACNALWRPGEGWAKGSAPCFKRSDMRGRSPALAASTSNRSRARREGAGKAAMSGSERAMVAREKAPRRGVWRDNGVLAEMAMADSKDWLDFAARALARDPLACLAMALAGAGQAGLDLGSLALEAIEARGGDDPWGGAEVAAWAARAPDGPWEARWPVAIARWIKDVARQNPQRALRADDRDPGLLARELGARGLGRSPELCEALLERGALDDGRLMDVARGWAREPSLARESEALRGAVWRAYWAQRVQDLSPEDARGGLARSHLTRGLWKEAIAPGPWRRPVWARAGGCAQEIEGWAGKEPPSAWLACALLEEGARAGAPKAFGRLCADPRWARLDWLLGQRVRLGEAPVALGVHFRACLAGWAQPLNETARMVAAAGGGELGEDGEGALSLAALGALEGVLESGAPAPLFVARHHWNGELAQMDESRSPLLGAIGEGQKVPLALLAMLWGAPSEPLSQEALGALAADVEGSQPQLLRAAELADAPAPTWVDKGRQGARLAWAQDLILRNHVGLGKKSAPLRV